MGKIADNLSHKIYLTDDNPRFENPKKIRNDIKKGINKKKVIEISDRTKAISNAVKNLNIGEILLVAGKGHEAIKIKNKNLSNNLKFEIIKETSGFKKFKSPKLLKKARINSKEVKKNDIFFAIKGKKNDGNKFVKQSFKRKASLAIVNTIQNDCNIKRQIKVKDTLKFLTEISKIFRKNIKTVFHLLIQ